MHKWWDDWKYIIFVIVLIIGALATTKHLGRQLAAEEQARRNAVCPSYLSIARSARDTLIIMRNDSGCTRFVLDELQ